MAKAISGLWHPSHTVAGQLTYSKRTGPFGVERCTRCKAHRWARPENYSADCGGSIDYDTSITRPCSAGVLGTVKEQP